MMAVVQYLFVVLAYTLASQVAGDWSCCGSNDQSVRVDLDNGNFTSTAPLDRLGFEIIEGFTDGPAASCDWQVVFKVTFDRPTYCEDQCTATCGRRMLRILMVVDDVRRGWLANFGDSRTNNGDKGDDSDMHTYDTNMVVVNETIFVHSNDNCNRTIQYTGGTANNITVRLASEYYRVQNSEGLDSSVCNGTCLYDLSGKYDTQLNGQNDFDLFLSFNKVIKAGSTRIGRGVCGALLKWECCAE